MHVTDEMLKELAETGPGVVVPVAEVNEFTAGDSKAYPLTPGPQIQTVEVSVPAEQPVPVNPTVYSSDTPKEEPGVWVIEMKEDGQWLKLGGKFDAKTADLRIDQFMMHYMYRPPGSKTQDCKRQFRRVKVG